MSHMIPKLEGMVLLKMDGVDPTTVAYLAHYGVIGMRWGKSSSRPSGTPRKTERAASKDAKEFAKAKMYYGEGAGIRRRQINNTVKSRSKDSAYKEAFNRNLANQDFAKAGAQARSKRKRTDAVNGTKKTARGINHMLRGNGQYASATAASLVVGATYAHKKGIDKMLLNKGKATLNSPEFKRQANNIKNQFKR